MRTLALLVLLAGCAHGAAKTKAEPAVDSRPLFDRLGGLPAITAVVDAFLGNIAADERINWRFAASDIPDLRQKLIDQVCQASGGPCVYKGRPMAAAHRGLDLNQAKFNAVAEDLQHAMAQAGIPYWTQNRLIARLAPMQRDIVTR